jgi:hypothetical protein
VVLGLSVIVLLKYQLLQNNPGNVFIPFTIYAFVVSLILSPVGTAAVLRSLGYWVVALLTFKFIQLVAGSARKYTVSFVSFLLFLFCVVNFILYFINANSFMLGRFMGFMANPNGLGMVSMFCYALLVFFRDHEKSAFPRKFFYILQVFLLFFIFVSGSRTALISVLGFEFLLRVRQNPLVLILSVFFLIAFNVFLNNSSVFDFLSNTGLSDRLRLSTLETGSGRTEVWKVAFAKFIEEPWIGKGMLYDDFFIEQYSNKFIGLNKARHWYGIWNSYLSMALNVGLIGIGLYGAAWYRLYHLSVYTVYRFAFLGLCLVSAVTESWMAASMNAFMPMVFLIWAFQIYPPKTTI